MLRCFANISDSTQSSVTLSIGYFDSTNIPIGTSPVGCQVYQQVSESNSFFRIQPRGGLIDNQKSLGRLPTPGRYLLRRFNPPEQPFNFPVSYFYPMKPFPILPELFVFCVGAESTPFKMAI